MTFSKFYECELCGESVAWSKSDGEDSGFMTCDYCEKLLCGDCLTEHKCVRNKNTDAYVFDRIFKSNFHDLFKGQEALC